jgi:HNH endonuclease
MNQIQELPRSQDLDTATFSRLLDDRTNSYKFLFLLSILDILSSRFFKVPAAIDLKEIAVEMLVNAWYPHSFFRLSFGLQDKIAQNLDRLALKLDKPILEATGDNRHVLRQAIAKGRVEAGLLRYVPFRLIRPFFEIGGLKDSQVNQQIQVMADRLFETRKPLYKFNDSATSILIHPEWVSYLQNNDRVVRGWVLWNWLQYMQRNNPSTPNIVSKILPSQERESLNSQTNYWKTVIANCPELQCIYSGQVLVTTKLSLDHYLPWSFVAHDRLYNLIPVPREVNSSKSDRIPSNSYFDSFVKIQHLGLTTFYNHGLRPQWNKYIEPYLVELGFAESRDLLNLEKLRRQYQLRFQPLVALAISQGFAGDWVHRKIS